MGAKRSFGRATTMVAPDFPAEQGKRSRKGHPRACTEQDGVAMRFDPVKIGAQRLN